MKIVVELPDGPLEIDDDRWRDLRGDADDDSPLPRLCYAAAHVVMDAAYTGIDHSSDRPGSAAEIANEIASARGGSRRGARAARGTRRRRSRFLS